MSRRRLERQPERQPSDDDRPDLRDVLEHYGVELSYRTSQMTRCPVHDDSTPSCSVNLDKGLWRCHACNAGGDVWTLIETKEGVTHQRARAFATDNGFTAGSTGGSDSGLRDGAGGGRYSGGLPRGTRNHRDNRPYRPAWRGRGAPPGA